MAAGEMCFSLHKFEPSALLKAASTESKNGVNSDSDQ